MITSHRFINSVTLGTRFTSPRLGLGDTDNRYHDARIQSILTAWVYSSQSFESIFFLHDILPMIRFFHLQPFLPRCYPPAFVVREISTRDFCTSLYRCSYGTFAIPYRLMDHRMTSLSGNQENFSSEEERCFWVDSSNRAGSHSSSLR